MIREYLVNFDGVYRYVLDDANVHGGIEIPDGAESAYFYSGSKSIEFYKGDSYFNKDSLKWKYCDSSKITGKLVWKRDKVEVEDSVNQPSHYTSGGIECLDAMQAMLSKDEFIGFLRGNVFKYNWRYKLKNGIEDLKKAKFYQDKLIEVESK